MSLGIKVVRRFFVLRLTLLVAILCVGGTLAQEISLQPFVIDHAGRTNSAADVAITFGVRRL